MTTKKRKSYPWQDKDYLIKECQHYVGVPDRKYIPRRYEKLWGDIMKIRYQLSFYHFPQSEGNAHELLSMFTNELRKEIFKPDYNDFTINQLTTKKRGGR